VRRTGYASIAALAIGVAFLAAAAIGPWAPAGQVERRDAGRILRVDLEPDFDSVDPALALLPQTWQVEYATCLKLMNFPDKEVSEGGSQPIPEAAGSPRISRDGRTYTLPIRTGLRFSTGVPVTAANFAYVMNRDLNPAMNSPGAAFLRDIVGAEAVEAGRAVKAAGITVLDPYRLRIRLRGPAPDFLSRLTLPYFCALPLDTPIDPQGIGAPVAAAGPYYVASWDRGRTAALKHNPFYRGPRPHRVDEIVYTFGNSLEAQRLRVEAGESDLGQFPPSAAGELAAKYGVNRRRFFVRHQLVVWFLALNREGHLFMDNDQLARAVNYAIDRPALERQHGAFAGTRTDQILPIGLSAFKDWSLYPLNGPDYKKASALAKGHLRDGKAKLWTFSISFGPNVAQVVAFDLKKIGIETAVTAFDPVVLREKAGRRGADYDIMVAGWSADYPDPFNFLNRLLSGNTIKDTNNVNFSYFDEPRWNRRMVEAAKLFGRTRDLRYALLDRDLMAKAAPIAPYLASNARIFVSARVGCFTYQSVYGTDLAALCLR
jgi:ABC-type oligopeptide transport system substrate-binding subunit